MQIEPPSIYFCPSCKKPMLKMNYSSYTVNRSDRYSDGYNTGHPHFTPNLGRCPNCEAKFFLHNLFYNKENVPYEEYKHYEYIEDPSLEDLIKVIKQGLPANKDEEMEARLCLWRKFNNKVRYNYRVSSDENYIFTDEEMKLWEENCTSLLPLLKSNLDELFKKKEIDLQDDNYIKENYDYYSGINNIRAYIVEVLRNLAQFDECIKQTETLPLSYGGFIEQIIEKCEIKDRIPFILYDYDNDDDDDSYDDDYNEENDEFDEIKNEKKIINLTKKLKWEGEQEYLYYGRADAYFRSGNFEAALDDINRAIELDNGTTADYFNFRAKVHEKLGNKDELEQDLFKIKLFEARELYWFDKENEDKNEENEDNENEKKPRYEELMAKEPIILTENFWDILENADGDILFCISTRDGEPVEPEIFYSGGENALLRRGLYQFILLDCVHEDAREKLLKANEVLIAEFNPPDEGDDPDYNPESGVIREYTVKIRYVIETLESINKIYESGYLLFTSLRAKLYVNKDKPAENLTGIIGKEDYTNLAAVLAREEDYELLEHTKEFWSAESLNRQVSVCFNECMPTPLFYITTYKIWASMKEPVKMFNWLVKHGADPDVPDGPECTPLGNQCITRETHVTGEGFRFCSYEIIKSLLEAGADPNKEFREYGDYFQPINLLILPDYYDKETYEFPPITDELVKRAELLFEYGAKPDITTLEQVLTYSIGEQRKKLVKMICEKGVNIEDAIKVLEKGAKYGNIMYCNALFNLYNEGEYVILDKVKAKKYKNKIGKINNPALKGRGMLF